MFNSIINFFNKKQNQDQEQNLNLNQDQNQKVNFCNIYNEQYRDAYNRLWIKEICNYYP